MRYVVSISIVVPVPHFFGPLVPVLDIFLVPVPAPQKKMWNHNIAGKCMHKLLSVAVSFAIRL